MATEMILGEFTTDRGTGPEIVGMRITVYHLLPDFLDGSKTEESICQFYNLTPLQVSSARAYIMNNWDEVWARHLEIEARIAIGNPPEVLETADRLRPLFLKFKEAVRRGKTRHHGSSPEVAEEVAEVEIRTQRIDSVAGMREWLAESVASSLPRS